MTNEEAIEVLLYACEHSRGERYPREKEAWIIAIKALEQQPCEDCISREAVLAKVNEYASIWTSWNDGMSKEQIAQEALNDAKDTMIQIIIDLPSVQPIKPKEEQDK